MFLLFDFLCNLSPVLYFITVDCSLSSDSLQHLIAFSIEHSSKIDLFSNPCTLKEWSHFDLKS